MADTEESSVPVVAVTAAVGAIVLLLVLLCGLGRKGNQEEQKEDAEESTKEVEKKSKIPKASNGGKKTRLSDKSKKEVKASFTHPWLAGSLKSHSSPVLGLDFSPNGKYLASCAEDRSVLLWSVKEFTKKERKSVRANVEYDHATQIRFSPDNKAFICILATENTIRVFRIGKKTDGSTGNVQAVMDFPKKHDQEIINIGIASSGRFIMTATKSTNILIWNIKGEVLASIDTLQMNNSHAAVSPCGRFFASSGFTPDVKVWEVCFDKVGEFREVVRAFELKGHTAGVYHFSFSADSARMATVSKDGSWKLWDTNVEYQKGQEPYLLQTGKYNHIGPSLIALAPDGRTVAIATGKDIAVYNANTTELAQTFENAHSYPVSAIAFELSSKFLISTGDKNIHVFHNVVGYEETVADLEQKKQKATNQALRERLQSQIVDAKAALEEIKELLGDKQ